MKCLISTSLSSLSHHIDDIVIATLDAHELMPRKRHDCSAFAVCRYRILPLCVHWGFPPLAYFFIHSNNKNWNRRRKQGKNLLMDLRWVFKCVLCMQLISFVRNFHSKRYVCIRYSSLAPSRTQHFGFQSSFQSPQPIARCSSTHGTHCFAAASLNWEWRWTRDILHIIIPIFLCRVFFLSYFLCIDFNDIITKGDAIFFSSYANSNTQHILPHWRDNVEVLEIALCRVFFPSSPLN